MSYGQYGLEKSYVVEVWKGSKLVLRNVYESYDEALDIMENYKNNYYRDCRVEFYASYLKRRGTYRAA